MRNQPQWETPRRSCWQLQQGLTNYGVKFQHFILISWELRLDRVLLKLMRLMLSKIKQFLSRLPGWALMQFVEFWYYHWCANEQISCTVRNLHMHDFWISSIQILLRPFLNSGHLKNARERASESTLWAWKKHRFWNLGMKALSCIICVPEWYRKQKYHQTTHTLLVSTNWSPHYRYPNSFLEKRISLQHWIVPRNVFLSFFFVCQVKWRMLGTFVPGMGVECKIFGAGDSKWTQLRQQSISDRWAPGACDHTIPHLLLIKILHQNIIVLRKQLKGDYCNSDDSALPVLIDPGNKSERLTPPLTTAYHQHKN